MQPFRQGWRTGGDLSGLKRSFKYRSMTPTVGAGIGLCPYWTDEGTEALTDVKGELQSPRAFLCSSQGLAGEGVTLLLRSQWGCLPPRPEAQPASMEDKKKKRSPKPCLTQPAAAPGTLRRVPVPTSHSGSLALGLPHLPSPKQRAKFKRWVQK